MHIFAENGMFVTAELGGGIDSRVPGSPPAVTARGLPGEPGADGPWQQWEEIRNDDGTFSYRCVDGHYLTAEEGGGKTVSTDRDVNSVWQRFKKVGNMLQCSDGVHYLRTRTDLGPVAVVDATGTTQGLTFRIGDGGTVPTLNGRLHVQGIRLFDTVGPYRWKICTGFNAQDLALQNRWDVLGTYFDWMDTVGGNGIRVFLNWEVVGLDYRDHPDYFTILRELCKFTRERSKRLLGTAICDQIPSGLGQQQDFLDSAFSVLNEFDHTLGECANEPYNGNSVFPGLFRRTSSWGSLMVARGMCRPDSNPASGDPNDAPYVPSLGYTTYQNGRSADWYRKAGKDGLEIHDGWPGLGVPGTGDATINNETMGAAEIGVPGRRSNRPIEFQAAGGGAGLFTSGITGHGDSLTMQRCIPPGPTETSCIKALFDSLEFVPIDAPDWIYTRYGPGHPPEPMPVQMDPADADETVSRMHAKVGPNQASAVNYNAAIPGREGWKAVAANGWRIVEQRGPVVLCER